MNGGRRAIFSIIHEERVSVVPDYSCTKVALRPNKHKFEFRARGRGEGAAGTRGGGHAYPVPLQTGERKGGEGCAVALMQHAVGTIRLVQSCVAGSTACERRNRRGPSVASLYRQ